MLKFIAGALFAIFGTVVGLVVTARYDAGIASRTTLLMIALVVASFAAFNGERHKRLYICVMVSAYGAVLLLRAYFS